MTSKIHLVITLTKLVKDLYNENFKKSKKQRKKKEKKTEYDTRCQKGLLASW